MAKLKARGRTELFRMVHQEPPDAEGVERRTVYAFMSDGIVLRNATVKYPPTSLIPGGRTYKSGWKMSNLCTTLDNFPTLEENLRLKGFVRGAL